MNAPLHHPMSEAVLLILLVTACLVGAVGMWRMREPMQALHYLSLPASMGAVLLVIAVFVEEGSTQISWKTLLVAGILFAINSVGAHATARAFRARELGHWEPIEGDPVELVRESAEDRKTAEGGRS